MFCHFMISEMDISAYSMTHLLWHIAQLIADKSVGRAIEMIFRPVNRRSERFAAGTEWAIYHQRPAFSTRFTPAWLGLSDFVEFYRISSFVGGRDGTGQAEARDRCAEASLRAGVPLVPSTDRQRHDQSTAAPSVWLLPACSNCSAPQRPSNPCRTSRRNWKRIDWPQRSTVRPSVRPSALRNLVIVALPSRGAALVDYRRAANSQRKSAENLYLGCCCCCCCLLLSLFV